MAKQTQRRSTAARGSKGSGRSRAAKAATKRNPKNITEYDLRGIRRRLKLLEESWNAINTQITGVIRGHRDLARRMDFLEKATDPSRADTGAEAAELAGRQQRQRIAEQTAGEEA